MVNKVFQHILARVKLYQQFFLLIVFDSLTFCQNAWNFGQEVGIELDDDYITPWIYEDGDLDWDEPTVEVYERRYENQWAGFIAAGVVFYVITAILTWYFLVVQFPFNATGNSVGSGGYGPCKASACVMNLGIGEKPVWGWGAPEWKYLFGIKQLRYISKPFVPELITLYMVTIYQPLGMEHFDCETYFIHWLPIFRQYSSLIIFYFSAGCVLALIWSVLHGVDEYKILWKIEMTRQRLEYRHSHILRDPDAKKKNGMVVEYKWTLKEKRINPLFKNRRKRYYRKVNPWVRLKTIAFWEEKKVSASFRRALNQEAELLLFGDIDADEFHRKYFVYGERLITEVWIAITWMIYEDQTRRVMNKEEIPSEYISEKMESERLIGKIAKYKQNLHVWLHVAADSTRTLGKNPYRIPVQKIKKFKIKLLEKRLAWYARRFYALEVLSGEYKEEYGWSADEYGKWYDPFADEDDEEEETDSDPAEEHVQWLCTSYVPELWEKKMWSFCVALNSFFPVTKTETFYQEVQTKFNILYTFLANNANETFSDEFWAQFRVLTADVCKLLNPGRHCLPFTRNERVELKQFKIAFANFIRKNYKNVSGYVIYRDVMALFNQIVVKKKQPLLRRLTEMRRIEVKKFNPIVAPKNTKSLYPIITRRIDRELNKLIAPALVAIPADFMDFFFSNSDNIVLWSAIVVAVFFLVNFTEGFPVWGKKPLFPFFSAAISYGLFLIIITPFSLFEHENIAMKVLFFAPFVAGGLALNIRYQFGYVPEDEVLRGTVIPYGHGSLLLMLSFFQSFCAILLWQNKLSSKFLLAFPSFGDLSLTAFSPNFWIDGLSLCFLLLTSFVFPICIFAANTMAKNPLRFSFYLLLLQQLLFYSFLAGDLFLFYISFEIILIPMFLIIGLWGSREQRIKAAYYFVLYTLFGSFFLLVGILYIWDTVGTSNFLWVLSAKFSISEQILLYLSCFMAFAIKIPVFPFHIWLPEAHVEAPTIGSVVLASLLLKLGGYGFLRFSLPLFPIACYYFNTLIYTLAVLSIVYAAFTAIRQIDLKRIIAYSSVSHMNLIVLGLFSFTRQGVDGAVYLMVAHGIVSAALFFCVGILYDRYHTRLLKYYGGLVQVMPLFSTIFFVFTLANMSFPGTANFIGELLILAGLYQKNTLILVLSSTSIVFGAAYSIWAYNRIVFGTLKTNYFSAFTDITLYEFVIFLPFLFAVFALGLNSDFILNIILEEVKALL